MGDHPETQDPEDHQDLQDHQDHHDPHHHHHHAQLSVSHNVSQLAQLPVAHRRNIKPWLSNTCSFVGWILAFISIESFSGHHRACSTSFCDVPFTIFVHLL